MTIVPFGEFLPDQPAFGSAGCSEAKNVTPAAKSYQPFKSLTDVSSGMLDSYCRGMIWGQDDSANTFAFACDAGKIYRLSAAALDDVSKTGGYTTADKERTSFVTHGDLVIAANFFDETQAYQIGVSAKFSDLSASAPKGRYLAIVGTQLVVASTEAADYRVEWSSLTDVTDFVDSVTTQAGFQNLANGGRIRGITGGEYGVILMERSLYRMEYVGGGLIYTFDEIEGGKGCLEPGSVIRSRRGTYYLADDGFRLFDGQQSHPIGEQKVNDWFFKRFDAQYSHRMSATFDVERGLIYFSYPTGGSGGEPSECLIYNELLNRWSYAAFDHEIIGGLASAGYTLEELDTVAGSLDDIPASLDSRTWRGGTPFVGAVRSRKLCSFTGPNLEAAIETGEAQIYPGRRALTSECWPLVDGVCSGLEVCVAKRDRQNDAVSYGPYQAQNAIGFCPARDEGRYHRAKLRIPAGEDWDHAVGIDYKAKQGGRR
ncbi:hypothetical protein [Kiloniella antarctica]|uniref:Uncharacterized protein n=1 Tax=Kiloniella antarctica TaxID=1550907 RepID=A0ABW5BMU4_9PROT